MQNEFSRMAMLIGEEKIKRLFDKTVAIFGVGGVGSYATEAIARAGIGKIVLIDHDTVNITNINRQLVATHSTIGRAKVDVAKERILDINPNAKVTVHQVFYKPEETAYLLNDGYDYIIDAIDNVTAKIDIIINAKRMGIPVISSMGTGNKLNPASLKVTDIYKTSVCPLARVMRYELKKRNVKDLKVVFSEEKPIVVNLEENNKRTPGSISFVPSVAGLLLAAEVINSFLKEE